MIIWKRSITAILLSVGCLGLCAGCAQTSLLRSPERLMNSAFGKKKTREPARILCLWESAEGQGGDGKPTHGFAGQILMFDYGEPTSVAVDGRVRVYQYDDYDPDEENPIPTHVFNFDSAGWNAHRAEGTVGETYNVFLPYMGEHKGIAFCGLQVEFIPENGRSITSPMTEITLERRRNRSRTQPALQRNIVKNPQPRAPEDPATTTRDDFNSLTIPLPKR